MCWQAILPPCDPSYSILTAFEEETSESFNFFYFFLKKNKYMYEYDATHFVMSVLSNLTIPSRPYPQHPSHSRSQPPPFSPNPNPRKPQNTVKAPSNYSTLGLILVFRISLGTKLLTLILTSVPGCCRNTVASVALLSCRCSRAAARPPGTPPGTPSNDTLGGRSGTSGTPSSAPIPTPILAPASPSPSDRFDPRRGRAISRSRCSSTRAACCETHELMVRKRASDDRAVATLSRPAAIGGAAAAVAAPFGLGFRFAFDARAPASAGVCGAWLFVQLKRLTSGPPKPEPGPGRGVGVEEVRRV